MIKGSIAKRYAKALIELAQEENQVDQFGEELSAIAKVMEEVPELFNSLRNPAVPREKRRMIMEAVIDKAAPHKFMKNFLLLLLEKRRIEALPQIAAAYSEIADEIEGKIKARVVSARGLDPAQISGIRTALQEKIGKTVILDTGMDRELIGGLVAQVGNYLFDFSIKSQLHKVQKELESGR